MTHGISILGNAPNQVQRIDKGLVQQAYDEVDEQVVRSLVAGTPDIALGYARGLIATGYMRGVQLMKLFDRLDEEWHQFETDDTVQDYAFAQLGVPNRKFDEYRDIYRYILKDHPELVGKPIQGLQGIIVAAREGDFTDEHWRELELAHDASTMIDIRRRVRGDLTSGIQRLIVYWERDGQVYSQRGDGERKHCGFLKRDVGDPDIDDAVFRLTNPDKTGVVKQ